MKTKTKLHKIKLERWMEEPSLILSISAENCLYRRDANTQDGFARRDRERL